MNIRLEDISPKIITEKAMHGISIIYPYVMIKLGPSGPMTRDIRLHPLWFELVEKDTNRATPIELCAHCAGFACANQARMLSPLQTLEYFRNLEGVKGGSDLFYRTRLQSLRTLINLCVLPPGDHGDVIFYYRDCGTVALGAFWADSIGAAKKFIEMNGKA